MTPACVVEGCQRGGRRKLGMCEMHYRRQRLTGDVGPAEALTTRGMFGPVCRVDGCEKPRLNKGYCGMHYKRIQVHGDPGVPHKTTNAPDARLREAPMGTERHNRDGYVIVKVGADHPMAKKNGWATKHRLVMSEMLGRPLRADEEVHHKNGLRNDNRPENLELWVRSGQPPGARVEDVLEWAREVVRRYG